MPIPLSRALRNVGGGQPLPVVWLTLEMAGIRPRLGQVTMIAGPPNAGKTLLALNYVLAVSDRIPTLYISADTDRLTLSSRAAGIILNKPVLEIEKHPENFSLGDRQVEFSWEAMSDFRHINSEVSAYAEKHGCWPKLIVIDNLLNIGDAADGDWKETMMAMRNFHVLARSVGCAVFVLHHTSESFTGTPCPPRAAIVNKVSQLPELIVTTAVTEDERMLLCGVKNRNGPSYPSGRQHIELYMDFETMRIYENGQAWHAKRNGRR